MIDEYYESALLDPKRAALIKAKIEKLVNTTHLQSDLNSDGKDIDTLLEVIDGYLCELKEAQIRGGLHIFGQSFNVLLFDSFYVMLVSVKAWSQFTAHCRCRTEN